ncbi:MAG: ABC transporter substrate-binding protein, partial [Alphaproteobacteria bacterium]
MTLFTRRSALALSAGLLAAPAVHAQGAFPNKPLRIIVPYPPGGVTDIMGRLAAESMARHLGQTSVVENSAGA